MVELVILAVAVAAIAAIGIAVGMLVAPALTRWSERESEEADGDR
jgi:hypothetical protein